MKQAPFTRYKKFHQSLLGERIDMEVTDIDIKEYVKFLLKEGTLEEKREVISCFNSQILLKDKTLILQK